MKNWAIAIFVTIAGMQGAAYAQFSCLSCKDGIKNNAETDVDCGGDNAPDCPGGCPNCAIGKHCLTPFDCETFFCDAATLTCQTPPIECGNGLCEPGEDATNCPFDCGTSCGNLLCEPGEDATNCPFDCGCADGAKDGFETDVDCGGMACAPCGVGQHCLTATDCGTFFCSFGTCQIPPDVCGDGFCGASETEQSCPQDCFLTGFCGDDICGAFENPLFCPQDCPSVCGDGLCIPPEDASSCPIDCAFAMCGNGLCEFPSEDANSCYLDCGFCGDGFCTPPFEAPFNCPIDCADTCGDGICSDNERSSGSCPADCVPVTCAPGYADCNSNASDGCETFDSDGDGAICSDNCPNVPNPGQEDWNKDGSGDACAPASDCQECVDIVHWGDPSVKNAATQQCTQLKSFDDSNREKRPACHAKCSALLAMSSYLSATDRQCVEAFCLGFTTELDLGLRCVP